LVRERLRESGLLEHQPFGLSALRPAAGEELLANRNPCADNLPPKQEHIRCSDYLCSPIIASAT